jgi:type III secretory pathway component EscS
VSLNPEMIGVVAREAIIVAILMSAPLVIAAAVVGLLFGLLQALTQLQDQTTAFAVKLVVVLGLMLLLMPWLGLQALGYAERLFNMILELR